MILVTGATGNVASVLIPALLADGQQVRALIHDESKAGPLKDIGVEVITGDMEKPESLDAAVAGVDKIYLLTTNYVTGAQQAINVINAAKSSGKPHIVRQSAFGTPKCRLIVQHEEVERELRDSGLPYTII